MSPFTWLTWPQHVNTSFTSSPEICWESGDDRQDMLGEWTWPPGRGLWSFWPLPFRPWPWPPPPLKLEASRSTRGQLKVTWRSYGLVTCEVKPTCIPSCLAVSMTSPSHLTTRAGMSLWWGRGAPVGGGGQCLFKGRYPLPLLLSSAVRPLSLRVIDHCPPPP